MTDSASELELESDTSSVDGTKDLTNCDQLSRRIEIVQQENRVLKTEVETLKLKIKGLNEINQQLRRNSVNIQAKAEQEEEYISNTLLKKITELKKEKESLALNYEQEEECLTNELNRKFSQLRQEKVALERTLAREQENQVSKLLRRIEKLEADMNNKQQCLDRLRREKVELENALEQEQEALVNRLWKKMEKLEAEKRMLQEKLETFGAPLPNLSNSGCGTSNISRPPSSGPGSLRGSFRHVQISPVCTAAPVVTSSWLLADSLNSPNRVSASATELKTCQVDHNATVSNENPSSKLDVSDVNTAASVSLPLPPQSPMDVDILEHNLSGAPSPCSLVSSSGSQNHSNSVKSPSTSCPPQKNPLVHENNPVNSISDVPLISQTISAGYVNRLRDEVYRLRQLLRRHEQESAAKLPQIELEEKTVVEENRRLRKLLQAEKERRETLSRQLSESESSLEMEDERQFNEASRTTRLRTISDSTSSFHPPSYTSWTMGGNPPSSLYGPGHAFAIAVAANTHSTSTRFCRECGQAIPIPMSIESTASSVNRSMSNVSAMRTCNSRCCSPIANSNSCDVHPAHSSTSPSTPTTASRNGEYFVKPTHPSFNSNVQMNHFFCNNMSSSVVGERHRYIDPEKRLSAHSLGSKELEKHARQLDDGDDDDDDARCVTPPITKTDCTSSDKCFS